MFMEAPEKPEVGAAGKQMNTPPGPGGRAGLLLFTTPLAGHPAVNCLLRWQSTYKAQLKASLTSLLRQEGHILHTDS